MPGQKYWQHDRRGIHNALLDVRLRYAPCRIWDFPDWRDEGVPHTGDQRRPRLVGNGNYQCQKTDHAEQSHFPMEVAQHHIPNGSIHRHPDPLTAVGTHKVIEKGVVHPIDEKEYVCVIYIAPCKASISAVILYTLIL